ncbi:hypothetical protein [Bacillus thermotolerans]|uniref:Uncharacterized protein n=1 Tax=Bacillus thermotolerans TaxID=1221996 RepID=A0A0F5HZM1_BACTR|nr:hypothetical protein [Bacillus thermotolerans]KKB38736.1 hypothetical protein QY97_01840 [Bacillus thermotolerans]KKB41317.1 hypothetical protein QY95_00797 [Bacillus thermotolerans]KKB44028.1 hypothetical protein QY96_00220 [Bacillus thermotolerans]
MIEWIVAFYGIQVIVIVILLIGSWLIWDRRFKLRHGQQVPEGFSRTKERFIDPTTGKKMVVYMNRETGERFYKEE